MILSPHVRVCSSGDNPAPEFSGGRALSPHCVALSGTAMRRGARLCPPRQGDATLCRAAPGYAVPGNALLRWAERGEPIQGPFPFNVSRCGTALQREDMPSAPTPGIATLRDARLRFVTHCYARPGRATRGVATQRVEPPRDAGLRSALHRDALHTNVRSLLLA